MNHTTIDYIYNLVPKDMNGLNSILHCISNIDTYSNMVNEIFLYHLKKDTQLSIKEYYKYYNHPLLTKYLVNMITINNNSIILDGNIKVNSFLLEILQDKNINSNNLYGYQNNKDVSRLIIKDILCRSNTKFTNLIEEDILLNDIKFNNELMNFDIIFFDLPIGIHNIIHAKCCNRIKNLKLRGTKSEPLLLQLIMMALNKNGTAIVIVPDCFLFSDSKQPIETREYLLNNYNVKKIIELDEKFYYTKGIKSSVIIFENNGKTSNIEFCKLELDDIVKSTNIINLSYDEIKGNSYLLYYKLYTDNIKPKNSKLEYIDVESIFKISNIKLSDKYLGLSKYYKNNKSIEINNEDSEIYIIEKKNDYIINDFGLYFMKYYLIDKIDLFIKGKMKQFDLDKILCIKIPILNHQTQKAVINYYIYTNNLYNSNISQIKSYKFLKKDIINTLNYNYELDLGSIICCSDSPNNNKMIGIIKNSLKAGKVYLLDSNINLSNNSYYLELVNNDFLLEYIYYYLYFIKDKLKELSKLTPQNNLIKSNLLSIKIPVIDKEIQKDIIKYCSDFDTCIVKLKYQNKNLINTDIMNIINRLYKLHQY